jgi:hypothetical protein
MGANLAHALGRKAHAMFQDLDFPRDTDAHFVVVST